MAAAHMAAPVAPQPQFPPGKLTEIMQFATQIHGYLSDCSARDIGPPQLLAAEAQAAALLELTRALRAEEEAALSRLPIWDALRLSALIAELGEGGVKDLLRLFQADMPLMIQEIASAVQAQNVHAAEHGLTAIQSAASNLGLAAVAGLAQSLRQRPLDANDCHRLAQEIARVRYVPSLQTAA